MSFVSAAAAAQSFSLESDSSDAHLVRGDSYALDTDVQERSPLDPNLISPYLSQADSDSISLSNTIDMFEGNGLASGLSQYQHGDLSDFEEDPFFAIDFADTRSEALPSLGDQGAWHSDAQGTAALTASLQHVNGVAALPLTPEQTVSIYATPRSDMQAGAPLRPQSISPRELCKPFAPTPLVIPTPQLGPSLDSSGQSSEEGLAPGLFDTASQSPRVTVSVWDQDSKGPIHTVERTFEDSPFPDYREASPSSAERHEPLNAPSHRRDHEGEWHRDPAIGPGGLEPKRRIGGKVMSINEIARKRRMEERNQEVGDWAALNSQVTTRVQEKTPDEIYALEEESRGANDDVPLGSGTENRYVLDQTYYRHEGDAAQMTNEDYSIILKNRNWADAPVLHEIREGTPGQNQPQSSQAAIEKFERMCRDNDSVISRAATWGTRRRSLPSVIDLDIEGITSGSFLKKLSIGRASGGGSTSSRPSSLLRDLRGLVRRPSAAAAAATIRKRSRSRSNQPDAVLGQQPQEQEAAEESPLSKREREGTSHLSPLSRSSSGGKKPTPSINEALLSLGHNLTSIGASRHSRSGSVSNPPTAGPSRSSLSSLSVKNSLRRQRSKSELPKPSGNSDSQSTLANLWWKSGGPPVAPMISKTHASPDEEEDEDEDLYEDQDMSADPNMIDDITPNIAGFQMHILRLNPSLTADSYLVERIAQQQVARYKSLLTWKIKHLGLSANCPSGPLCLAMNGSATVLDQKVDVRELDAFSSFDDDDVAIATTEGAISQERFPADIPMPPTRRLPAEFECQLCFQPKKMIKPSDWTKHVHEDVQPFTCTWERCREPKMFKRKADWVRHENEGHRHLERWVCDVDECQHVCHRRDNFLQHLVREHKFVEPKIKSKAALKKSSNLDPTWKRVERCHEETTMQPEEEPCRFCGKRFPTWKRLTVHLAKHMEQIALPVLRLVAAKAKDMTADTVISPVVDRPSRFDFGDSGGQTLQQYPIAPQQMGATSLVHSRRALAFDPSLMAQDLQQQQQQSQFLFSVMPPSGPFHPQFYSPRVIQNMGQNLPPPSSSMNNMLGQASQSASPDMRVGSSAGFARDGSSFMMGMAGQDLMTEQFPGLDGLGLQLQAVGMGRLGGQPMYDGVLDASSGNGSPFSRQEGASPYLSRSPQPQAGHWDDLQFM